jgi:hypothetical protein
MAAEIPEPWATTLEESTYTRKGVLNDIKRQVQRRACDDAIIARAYSERVVADLEKQVKTITL